MRGGGAYFSAIHVCNGCWRETDARERRNASFKTLRPVARSITAVGRGVATALPPAALPTALMEHQARSVPRDRRSVSTGNRSVCVCVCDARPRGRARAMFSFLWRMHMC